MVYERAGTSRAGTYGETRDNETKEEKRAVHPGETLPPKIAACRRRNQLIGQLSPWSRIVRSSTMQAPSASPPAVSNDQHSFVPALAFHWATPLYQSVVDLFCRDTYIKSLVVSRVHGQHLRILDIACGPGKLVAMLAEKQGACCDIIGADFDPHMVTTAKQNTSAYSNVNIVQADCTKLRDKFDVQSFDIVIESLVFHHLSDDQKRAAIDQIAIVLKEDGIFYFVDWVKPESAYSKVAFNIVKILDGHENTAAHGSGAVLDMIETRFKRTGDDSRIETSVGTIGVISWKKR